MSQVVNPLRAKLDIMAEQTEAMLEHAERIGKTELAEQFREVLAKIESLAKGEEPLIDEEQYNNLYSKTDNEEENDYE